MTGVCASDSRSQLGEVGNVSRRVRTWRPPQGGLQLGWLSCRGHQTAQVTDGILIYVPLRNQAFDELFKRIPFSRGGNGVVVPKKNILRYLVDYKKRKGHHEHLHYISDQGPQGWGEHPLMASPLLNHPRNPCVWVAERIMRR